MRRVKCILVIALFGQFIHPPITAQESQSIDAVLNLISSVDDPQFQYDLLNGLSFSIKKGDSKPDGWDQVESKILNSPNERLQRVGIKIGVTFKSVPSIKKARSLVLNPGQDVSIRHETLMTLLSIKDKQITDFLPDLFECPLMRNSALEAMAQMNSSEYAGILIEKFSELVPSQKRLALNILASDQNSAESLILAIKEESISRNSLSAEIVRLLKLYDNEKINLFIKEVWGEIPDSNHYKEKQLRAILKTVRVSNPAEVDLSSGRATFIKLCSSCHKLFGQGGRFGPDLTGSNRIDPYYLAENIVYPSALVPVDFHTTIIETTDFRVLSGIIKNHNTNEITLQTPSGEHSIQRNEIADLNTTPKSIMPEGLLNGINQADIQNLFAYFSSPTQVPIRLERLTSNIIYDGTDLSNWFQDDDDSNVSNWSLSNGEIIGKSDGDSQGISYLLNPFLVSEFHLQCEVLVDSHASNPSILFLNQLDKQAQPVGFQLGIGRKYFGHLSHSNNSSFKPLRIHPVTFRTNQWHHISIKYIKQKLVIRIDDKLSGEYSGVSKFKEGMIGFKTDLKSKNSIRVRNLQITPIYETRDEK